MAEWEQIISKTRRLCDDGPDLEKNLTSEKIVDRVIEMLHILFSSYDFVENQFDDEDLDTFLEALEALKIVVNILDEADDISIESVFKLTRCTIDLMCTHRESEIAAEFDTVIHHLLYAVMATDLVNFTNYVDCLYEICCNCVPGSSKWRAMHTENVYEIMSEHSIEKLRQEDDYFFSTHLVKNIVSAAFVNPFYGVEKIERFQDFWDFCKLLLIDEKIDQEFILKTLLEAIPKMFELKVKFRPVSEHINFLDEMFDALYKARRNAEGYEEQIALTFKCVEKCIKKNLEVLIHKKLHRDLMIKWLNISLKLLPMNEEILACFSKYLIVLCTYFKDPIELPRDHSFEATATAFESLKKLVEMMKERNFVEFSNLSMYFDILLSLNQLANRPSKQVFNLIDHELSNYESPDDQRWPIVLTAFMDIRHPSGQEYFRKLTPTVEDLWTQIKRSDCFKKIFCYASLHANSYILNNDDGGRQLISILLLGCFKDLRSKFGTKWNNFRIFIGGRNSSTFTELEQFLPIVSEQEAAFYRTESVQNALAIQKKNHQIIPLIADMVLAVLPYVENESISSFTYSMLKFLKEKDNHIYANDCANALIQYMAENKDNLKGQELRMVCKIISDVVRIASTKVWTEEGAQDERCSKTSFDFKTRPENPQFKLDEKTMSTLISHAVSIWEGDNTEHARYYFDIIHTILLYSVETPTLSKVFLPMFDAMKALFSNHGEVYIRCWELIEVLNSVPIEKMTQIYILKLSQSFRNETCVRKIEKAVELVLDSKLPYSIIAMFQASLFVHATVLDKEPIWNLFFNRTLLFAQKIINEKHIGPDFEILHKVFKRYSSIFTRVFITRLLNDSEMLEWDENELRERLRIFVFRCQLHFRFGNLISALIHIRPGLLHWALAAGAIGHRKKNILMVIDFLSQELIPASSSNGGCNGQMLTDIEMIKAQRKALIIELFPILVEYWKTLNYERKEALWWYCEEHCGFTAEDKKNVIGSFRKDVIQRILIVAADELENDRKDSIGVILKGNYEKLHNGKVFSTSSAMEFKNEGIDFLLEFRRRFTQDEGFTIRHLAAKSFLVLISKVSKLFFEQNWYSILLALRHCPELEETTKCWMVFLERIDYSILRECLWRFVADLSKVENRDEILRAIFKRFNYLNAFSTEVKLQAFLWVIPHSIEVQIGANSLEKYRRIDHLIPLMQKFEKYPITLFAKHIRAKFDRNLIWKRDLPQVVNELVNVLMKSEIGNQQKDIWSIIENVPVLCSEEVDSSFVRWDKSSTFFLEPCQRTQLLIEECILAVERPLLVNLNKLEYIDSTICEIYKFMNGNYADERKYSMEGIRSAYMKMAYKPKPEIDLVDAFDGTESFLLRADTFSQWLAFMIVLCIQNAGPEFESFIPIAHVNDINFQIKLFTKFLLFSIFENRTNVLNRIFEEFDNVLNAGLRHRISKLERGSIAVVFYIFDFLYFYINIEEMKKVEKRTLIFGFWKKMLESKPVHSDGNDAPLLVRVAEKFGMEKRCIQWLEMDNDLKQKDETQVEKQDQASYYFYLLNLYARAYDLNGVRGAFSRLSKVQVDHVYGKIAVKEAYGNINAASAFYHLVDRAPFDPLTAVENFYNEVDFTENRDWYLDERLEHDELENSIKCLMQWVKVDKDIGENPYVYLRNIESRAVETKVLTMIKNNSTHSEKIDEKIENSKRWVIGRMQEVAIGGNCSYETAVPFLVRLQTLDEMKLLKNASVEELVDGDSELWKMLTKRTGESEQRLNVLEPILRARRSILEMRIKQVPDKDKDKIRSKIVESLLHCARVARLHGCPERAQLYIINAKKVMPVNNTIVLEEAKLQIQSCDELSGMNLLNSILKTTFGELTTHFEDTQQTENLDLKSAAKMKIENFPIQEKNLYSSVQMLRISQTIKAGNTIGFDGIYEETTNLLNAFVSSGVMYEAAWLLDYLHLFQGKQNSNILSLLKAYREVAKYEKNTVLQARAIERMTTLWLMVTRKLRETIDSSKMGMKSDLTMEIKKMCMEMKEALKDLGWRAFYPAYAILARNIDHRDEEVFSTMKKMMIQLIVQLPHQCMWQSVYILKSLDSPKIKRYEEVLNHVKKKHKCYATIIEQYDFASATFLKIAEKVGSNTKVLSEAVPSMKLLFREKKYNARMLSFDRRDESENPLMGGIMLPIRSHIDESVQVAREFSETDYTATCELDDRYLIQDFNERVKVLASKSKPILIEVISMSGRKFRLICKKIDDLTKDYHFSKIVEMCNDLMSKDEQTRIMNMHATSYSVIPLARQGGIIEFMDGVIQYFEAVEKNMGSINERLNLWKDTLKNLPKSKKAHYFREVCCKETPKVMADWFRQQYPESGKWFASRKLFAKSTAVMSIIGYIFGLGDRHTRNLMIHLPTGKCVHVDFDMIFNAGEFLKYPELVPFRLTQNMVNGMGEVALDGEFRVVCEQTLRVFRENSFEIEKYIADLPDLVTSENIDNSIYNMKEAKRLVSGRLRGQIMTAKIYRNNAATHPMKCVQLASSLIELATSDEKLCEMFHGWMASV